MAEAVVEERSATRKRFYCHMCCLEINNLSNDYTCPMCSGGFIEELPPRTPGTEASTSASANNSSASGSSNASSDPAPDSYSNRMNDLVASLLMSRSGFSQIIDNINVPQELEISIDGSGSADTNNSNGGRNPNVNRRTVVSGGGSGAAGRQRQPNIHRLDNVFLEFLSSLSSGDDSVFGNSQMFFMGNPGDYAWGREGIDTVVTQLLNHMDTSGPPPLPKEKIAEIPTVEISETEIEQKLKCSVCWEDFKLQEAVRKLPCLHLYHENCIVPWLDLHGTCPICRKSLQIEPSTSCFMHNGVASTSGNTDLSVPTATVSVTVTSSQPGTSNRTSTSTNSRPQPMDTASSSDTPPPPSQATQETSATGRSGQNSNLMAFEDGNVEYDFD